MIKTIKIRRALHRAALLMLFAAGVMGQKPCFAKTSLTDSAQVLLGQQVYRQGRLDNSQPAKALVLDDVPVSGTQFPCLNCHRRSGWGSAEGTKPVLPVSVGALFSPRTGNYRRRPSYTDKTLARVIKTGIDPAGIPLDSAMPRYDLPVEEMTALVAYLKTLSKENSPGLTSDDIHLATIIGENVEPETSKAMLDVLNEFFQVKNSQTRGEVKRVTHRGYFFNDYKHQSYRKWILHPWVLKGPPASWPVQLKKYYQQQPVFALISGIVKGDWAPIHKFCEKNQIPCLLPNSDQPVVNQQKDFYTLYFSKGFILEAGVILEHLARTTSRGKIVQVFRTGGSGAFAARALKKAAAKYPQFTLNDLSLTPGQTIDKNTWEQIENTQGVASVLWLKKEDYLALAAQKNSSETAAKSYLSSSLLGQVDVATLTQHLQTVFLADPFNLPEVRAARFRRAEIWLKSRKINISNRRIQGQTLFACMVFGEGMMHIKQHFQRDYLLDVIDHGEGMTAYTNSYPRLSFGPEQRYLAKGAYIVDLSRKKVDSPMPHEMWIVP